MPKRWKVSLFPEWVYLISGAYFLNGPDFSHCAFIGYYDVGITAVVHQCYTRRTKGRRQKWQSQECRLTPARSLCMLKRQRLHRSYRNMLRKQELQHLLRKNSRSQMGELFILDGKTITVDLKEARKTEELKSVTLNASPTLRRRPSRSGQMKLLRRQKYHWTALTGR